VDIVVTLGLRCLVENIIQQRSQALVKCTRGEMVVTASWAMGTGGLKVRTWLPLYRRSVFN